jgi:hypothetical protein
LLNEIAKHWGTDDYREIARTNQSMTDDLMRRDLQAYDSGPIDDAWDTQALDEEIGARKAEG